MHVYLPDLYYFVVSLGLLVVCVPVYIFLCPLYSRIVRLAPEIRVLSTSYCLSTRSCCNRGYRDTRERIVPLGYN